jgi:hypothetical protein
MADQVPFEKYVGHGHYEYISKISLEDVEESDHACPICLVGFLKGQRVINLRCHHSHIFHQDCISVS